MNNRLWYPQLDVYESVRRLGLLLLKWTPVAPTLERLYIADFYLANPPLLHQTSMPLDVRRTFQGMRIARPSAIFLSYPAPQLLFKKMEPIQKNALQAMTGKGITDVNSMRVGKAEITPRGIEILDGIAAKSMVEEEAALVDFLVTKFASVSPGNNRDFRQRTRLRRIV